MAAEIITREDLHQFKLELLQEIKALVSIPNVSDKQWLKSAEVCKLLKISPGTLQTLRIKGILSFSKIGGILYYQQEKITEILNGGLKKVDI